MREGRGELWQEGSKGGEGSKVVVGLRIRDCGMHEVDLPGLVVPAQTSRLGTERVSLNQLETRIVLQV